MANIRNPNCRLCQLHETAEFVCLIGKGPTPAKVMMVGEAPGHREDDSGKPFVGQAGKLLTSILDEIGVSREDVYITNAVHCRPPDNRTPTRSEIKACSLYLKEEIEAVQPEKVIVLGASAMQATIGRKGITEARGKVVEKDGIQYCLTYHPAYALRNMRALPVLKSDLRRFLTADNKKDTDDGRKWILVDNLRRLNRCLEYLDHARAISYDIETNGLDPFAEDAKIYTLALGDSKKQFVIPFEFPGSPWDNEALLRIVEMVDDVTYGKELIAQNGKFDNKWLEHLYGWFPEQTFDTMLAGYVLDENAPHNLEYMVTSRFHSKEWKIDKPITPEKYTLRQVAEYNGDDVYNTHRLYRAQRAELKQDPGLHRVFHRIIMPVSRALTRTELDGIYIDEQQFPESLKLARTAVKLARREFNRLSPTAGVNPNSPKQLSTLLFDTIGLDPITETKTGYSTAESVLLQLRDKHPIIQAILDYRAKIKTLQFLTSWEELMVDSRLHPNFKIAGTVTGRLSCENPNIQQVPRDVFLRSLFTAPPGWSFVEADYSQVELRIAAMLSGDTAMLRAFQTGGDIHRLTASQVSGIPQEEVTKEDRKKAKAVNFGFVYGMGSKKFREYARDKYEVHLSEEESAEFRQRFFNLYSGLPSWHERQRKLVRKLGYVRSPMGRKRRLPEITSSDKKVRGEAERQAINSPVQSFASDLTLFSLARLVERYPRKQLKVVAQVHDALLFVVKDDILDEAIENIRQTMEDIDTVESTFKYRITVPLEVEIKVGPWGKGVVR